MRTLACLVLLSLGAFVPNTTADPLIPYELQADTYQTATGDCDGVAELIILAPAETTVEVSYHLNEACS
jgi:hypothetical protein